MPRWTAIAAWVCSTAYLVGVGVSVNEVPHDIGLLALVVAPLLVLASLRREPTGGVAMFAQFAMYVAVVVAVYLEHVEPGKSPFLQSLKWAVFPALGLAVIVRMRLSRERRFEISPLDVLVVFIAIALPNLPGLRGAPSNLGLSVVKLLLLLYAVEMLTGHSFRVRRWLWRSGGVLLALLAMRGLFPGLA
jgi:hypothetical protein